MKLSKEGLTSLTNVLESGLSIMHLKNDYPVVIAWEITCFYVGPISQLEFIDLFFPYFLQFCILELISEFFLTKRYNKLIIVLN
jgi:hypothetical protein